MEVGQIGERTGVSHDHWNEYVTVVLWLYQADLPRVANVFRGHPVKKYEERFPLEKYEDVVTDENRARITRLKIP